MAGSATDPGTGRQLGNIPAYKVELDGKDITDRFRPRLVSLRLSEKRGGEADQLDIVLDDAAGDLAIPKEGVVIRMWLGWAQGKDVSPGLVDKGRFKVDEASHGGPPDQITIRARSADLDGGYRTRKERSWRATTLGAVIRQIAADNGLEARIGGNLAGIAIPVLEQHEKSDMALVRELGRKYDAVATVKDRKLLFSPVGSATTTSGAAIPALALQRRKGKLADRHEYRRVARETYDGAEARWHDQDSATRKTVKVGGKGAGKPKRLKHVYATEADAKAAASSEAKRAARAGAEMDLQLALGDAAIYPDRPTTLTGWKAEIDAQKWLIAEVEHSVDSAGFRTMLKLETAG
jgi:phage protein D